MPFTIVTRAPNAYIRVAEEISRAIASGECPVGSRLPPERELAVAFGVSRPTIREALSVLAVEGLVDIKLGSGTFVRSVPVPGWLAKAESATFDSPVELLYARRLIEPVIVAEATRGLTAEGIASLRQAIERMEASFEEREQFYRSGLDFHVVIAQATGNRALVEISRYLVQASRHPLWDVLNNTALESPALRRAQIDEHRAIVDAMEDHDLRRACSLMESHLRGLGRDMLDERGESSERLAENGEENV